MVVIRGPNVRMPSRCAQDVPRADLWTPPSPASRRVQEANRGLFEPMYGRFTWGKLVIRDCRERARVAWGPQFSLGRFHAALFELGRRRSA